MNTPPAGTGLPRKRTSSRIQAFVVPGIVAPLGNRVAVSAAAPKPSPARGAIRDRVTRFLLDLGSRLGSRGLEGREFALGLSREEIADLLDTRVETVSRVLQKMIDEERAARPREAPAGPVSAAA